MKRIKQSWSMLDSQNGGLGVLLSSAQHITTRSDVDNLWKRPKASLFDKNVFVIHLRGNSIYVDCAPAQNGPIEEVFVAITNLQSS